MGYSDIINRNDAKALQPDQTIINEIIEGTVKGSKALQLFTRLPNMTGKQAKLPVLNLLPEGYWVSGDTGLKQTSKQMWENKFIIAEELAVIIPIPEAVLDDANYDIWAQVKPRVIEAFGKKIDQAIFTGVGKPASFREGLIPTIINAGASIAPSTDTLYTQISKAMGKVETSGYDVNGIVGGVGLKQAFRDGFVDTTGQPLNSSEVLGLTREFVDNGAWDNSLAKLIVGDFKQAVFAIRQDVTFKILDQGVITDGSGNVVLNLAQQDCVALRAVMRLGWEVPNAVNATNNDETSRFPFALVEPASPATTYNVTFTVTDSSSSAVSGAKVTFAGEVKKTNSSGQAVFKSLGNSSYYYKVEKSGAETKYGEATVTTSNVSVNVTNF